MENLTKRQIVETISEESNLSQNAIRAVVQATIDQIQEGLARGQNVEFRNFGVFEQQVREERIGRNPAKPEVDILIPRQRVIKFRAGKVLKTQLQS
tara:strand:+ start:833 stop:1120 length:288 start_codon:yes stop_codon:yes gene_type:complete